MEIDDGLTIFSAKLKKLLTISFFVVLGSGLNAQQSNYADSLNVLFQKEETDSLKSQLLKQAFNYYFLDNIDTSFVLARKILDTNLKMRDTIGIANVQLDLASLYNAQGKYGEALKYDRQAYEYLLSVNDRRRIAVALNGLGEDYLGLGLYNEAFSYYQESLSMAEEVRDSLMSAVVTYNIGRVFKKTGQLAKSAEFIRRSMMLSEAVDDKIGQAYSLNDLGEIFFLQGEYDNALKSLETALTVAEKLDEDVIIPGILSNIAKCHAEKGDNVKAIIYYNKAALLFKKQSNDIELAKIDLNKGKIALVQNDKVRARYLFDQALKVAKSNNNAELLINTLNELSLWYEISGLPTESLRAIRKSASLKDSLEAINRNQQFSQTLMEFEIGRKDLAIAELNAQQLLRQEQLKNEEFLRNVLVVILAFTAVLLFTLYRNSVKSKRTNEMLVQHQKEIEAKSRELQSLLSMKDKFFSIVSHDLRSPINGLVGILDMLDDGYITQEELVKVTVSLRQRLGSTSKMLDNLLDWALVEMNEITLKWEEINLSKVAEDNLMSFKDINEKNVRFVNKIKPHVRVKADRNMLDLILRNLISNSVKFMENDGEVTLSALKAENHKFTVKVTDNGVGMNTDQLDKIFDSSVLYTTRGTANEKGTGLGLKLCKEFIEKMGGTIWVESEEGKGSTFNFTLQNLDKK